MVELKSQCIAKGTKTQMLANLLKAPGLSGRLRSRQSGPAGVVDKRRVFLRTGKGRVRLTSPEVRIAACTQDCHETRLQGGLVSTAGRVCYFLQGPWGKEGGGRHGKALVIPHLHVCAWAAGS